MNKRGNATQGWLPIGLPAYGYRVDDHGIPKVYELGAKIVCRFFRENTHDGATASAITVQLAWDNDPLPPGGAEWRRTRAYAILNTEIEMGMWRSGKPHWINI